ncbi:Cytochrome c [Roseateles sp. YR242]|uniref:c-type cytochrome n=1 Tax=Roseateles sp. YR242 TaxID=1855305 RepID=UPI0008C36783|nr:c-type cytochrome [Roseateles sp. YR242]SEL18311.1 Cytochrome c [Roseateles sp. YR242]
MLLSSRPLRVVAATLLVAALLGAGGALAFVWGGFYDVSATGSHWRPVHRLLEVALRQSVRQRAASVTPPVGLADPARQLQGAACFRDRCVACHGAPGIPPEAFALGLQPVPSSLVEATRHWRPAELYWITRHGIKMSGMPAWEYRLGEEELWAVVAFLDQLPTLTPDGYRRLTASAATSASCHAIPESPAAETTGWAPDGMIHEADGRSASRDSSDRWASARRALAQHGCVACHMIPGVVGPETGVGPRLEGLAGRQRIGSKVPADEEGLSRWIRDPQAMDPHTAMPTVGISETQARLMADYLLKH